MDEKAGKKTRGKKAIRKQGLGYKGQEVGLENNVNREEKGL